MNYISTRNALRTNESVSSACAIKRGLAGNGGLYMPTKIPQFKEGFLSSLLSRSYTERAAEILSLYLTDYTKDELLEDATAAYSKEKFPEGATKMANVNGNAFLELWHGPTCAFKDMALQLMPRLLSRALKKTGEDKKALILVATSGDTGKAALEGYRDVDNIKIQVFYPDGGVSQVQKQQMVTQEGSNVEVTAVYGNFDDAQTAVKRIFLDKTLIKEIGKAGYIFSSANSINFGRLVPQIVYYVSAYLDLVNEGRIALGDEIDICVPTGNFGNILAAYMAKKMGLPVNKFICASNKNNVLTDFINTGVYNKKRDFNLTISPSMDILVSSNLERLLYLIAGDIKTRNWMRDLRSDSGAYTVDYDTLRRIQEEFVGIYATEDDTKATINRYYKDCGYLIDPHTAVGAYACDKYREQNGSLRPVIVASTASPYKFASSCLDALGYKDIDGFDALYKLAEVTNTVIPAPLAEIKDKEVRFTNACTPSDMPSSVLSFAGIVKEN